MIIDCRLRPATQPYLKSTVTFTEQTRHYHKTYSVGVAPSVLEESVELCLQEMDEAKIDLGCCPARWGVGEESLVPPEEVVRVMTEYPGRFYGAVAVNQIYMEKSLDIIEKFVINGPVKAVCLEPGINGTEPMYFDDKRIFPIYELLEDKNIPLFLMAGGLVGTDISYSNPVSLSRMLNLFPHLTVIDIHASIPWVDEAIFTAVRCPNLFLCPDMYLMNTPFADRFIQAANGMIQDQFLFGTSYPFIPMGEYMEIWNTFPIKDSVRDKIMYQNAARALNLDPESVKRF